ncbi:MAG TPA: family 1 glycosylhydrolase, partial [Chloroflexota bacterium]|nr:family 1 glycosylhydrolase [Chloroflexota bacterium]
MNPKPFALPEGFRFGVATAGFQVEGGYNGPREPRNNWYWWEKAGRVEPSGIALDFWNRYEAQLDLAKDVGCDSFRLSVEWARCEPSKGKIDKAAFKRYSAILKATHGQDKEPIVTHHQITHPEWLGMDFWLEPESPALFAAWVRMAVQHLGDYCRRWVTVNEPNTYIINSYLAGIFPPGRLFDRRAALRAVDNMLTGHVKAYEEIHRQQPTATVATNNFCFSIYQFDRLLLDLLLARRNGVLKGDLSEWLHARKLAWEAAHSQPSLGERLLRRIVSTAFPLGKALPNAADAVYDSPYRCTLDVTQFDYYNPIASNHVRLPGHRSAKGRHWVPARLLWDDPPTPEQFLSYMHLGHEPGLQLWITENGLCNP